MGRTVQRATASRDEIEALLVEAGQAGDDVQVRLCRRALAGEAYAWKWCAEAIAEAAYEAANPMPTYQVVL